MPEIYKRSDNIISRLIAGENILVPIREQASDMENIYVLNEVGSRIWELVDGKRDINEISGILIEEFEAPLQEIKEDAVNFLSALEKAGLVKWL